MPLREVLDQRLLSAAFGGGVIGSTGSFGVPRPGSSPGPRARPRPAEGGGASMSHGARPLTAVVLAAGEGTRMKSAVPKVLHPLCGRPMLLHVIDALTALTPELIERIVVVVGHGAEL